MKGDLAVLEASTGYVFRDRELLERALTHKSFAHEQNAEVNGAPHSPAGDNEQLEFLGDSILGFVASEYLVRRNPDAPEGRLSKMKAHLVSAAHLHEAAQILDLGTYLFLGRGEEMSGGREKKALLADGLEALIAAIYLDAGLAAAHAFIETHVLSLFDPAQEGMTSAAADHKSALQEMAQVLKLPPPRYVIVGEDGPEHLKQFTVEVRVGKDWVSQAQGTSKKAAGQKAAQHILQQLTEWGR
jgi:ribonuclease III